MTTPLLQVLIVAYGADGIRRVAAGAHPAVSGVEYLVSWQKAECEIPSELERPDFRIVRTTTRGSASNHNNTLRLATAPLLLLADDDLSYSAEGLRGIIDAFDRHPDCDILTFKYDSDCPKRYPEIEFPITKAPKGYYTTMFEIAFRRASLPENVRFNEHFGVNCDFCAGEEDLFLHAMLESGMKGRFIPETICFHPGPTTCDRKPQRELLEAKGAVFTRLKPYTWPLRMIAHALRAGKGRFFSYCSQWYSGVRKARRLKVFES